jgi:hypothetical protein
MHQKFELRHSPELRGIIAKAFPSYRRKTASFGAFAGPVNISSYWDGGSRNEFAIVSLETGQVWHAPRSHPYFEIAGRGMANQSAGPVHTDHVGNVYLDVLPPNCALVEAGTFCGKPAHARISLNPENLAKLLPA